MASSPDVEKKIRIYYTIEDVISVMKAYAGVMIRKTEETLPCIREYEKNLLLAMADVMTHYTNISLGKRNGGKRILIAFGSSQGLCGPFNEKMADHVSEIISDQDFLFVIGRRLQTSLESRRISYKDHSDSVLSITGIQQALKKTVSQIMDIYKNEEFYSLTVVFTYIVEKKAQISTERILPPDVDRMRDISPVRHSPFTYLDPASIFSSILEEFLYISLYRCYAESLMSENWYRSRSMEGASETLKKHLSELRSQQKYIRQEEITEEMLEIMGSGMFFGSGGFIS